MLKTRLDGRVDKMIESGMWDEIEEMKRIYDDAVERNKTSEEGAVDLNSGIWQSIGFKEFLPYLDLRSQGAGEKELQELRQTGLSGMKTATRQYARSQIKWIRIKFLNALKAGEIDSDGQAGNRHGDIFLLDSTDASIFSETVSRTAVDIAKSNTRKSFTLYTIPILTFIEFTSGQPLLDPLTLSALAAASLTPKRAYDLADRPDLWVQRVCELCGVTCTNDAEWRIHEKSQRHKKTVSREKRRPEVEAFIRRREEAAAKKGLLGELVGVLEARGDVEVNPSNVE